jgi:hypothetical protein
MDKATPDLLDRFDGLVDVVPDANRKLVFGSPACLVAGNMFFGVHATGLFVRLPPEAARDLLAAGGAAFEPMPGRAMSGFYVLPAGLSDQDQWVRRSFDFARTLPPKPPKTPKTPKPPTTRP